MIEGSRIKKKGMDEMQQRLIDEVLFQREFDLEIMGQKHKEFYTPVDNGSGNQK